jgi:hypothetical protein
MGPTRALPWALAFVVVCTATPASALPILRIAAPTTVAPGSSFTVDVIADLTQPDEGFDVFDLYAFSFGLAFDPAMFAVQTVTDGTFLSDQGPTFSLPPSVDNVGGTVSGIASSLEGEIAGAAGSGVLLSLQFTALMAGVGTINITFDPFFDALLNSQLILLNAPVLEGATLTVAETPAGVPEPGTLLLIGLGAGLATIHRRRARFPRH